MSFDEQDFASLMEEPPGGPDPRSSEAEFLSAGGWSIVDPVKDGLAATGMSAHRGVLHPDEYIDAERLRDLVADRLGFTIEEIESTYANGRPSAQRASIRAHIDARLLALSRSGGNMLELGRALGWDVQEDRGHRSGRRCQKMERAIERARVAEVSA